MLPSELDPFTPYIAGVLRIEDITTGGEKQGYMARYRGQLYGDSTEAYDRLAADLRPMGVTPLFRSEKSQHVILLLQGTVNPRPSNPWINLLFFVLTALSVLFIGTLSGFSYLDPGIETNSAFQQLFWPSLWLGILYTVSLLGILVAHEFGHYLAGRYHKTNVTLPYFIPMPLPPLGTMGAFIRLKEPPKNKRILLDIGIAGPLAGLVVAVPVLLLGLSLSKVGPIPAQPGLILEGNSILYLVSKYMVFSQWLPAPASYGGISPILYWIQYFFTGRPLPLGGTDVMLHPIAWAGWAGLLVTALNLIPAGQLDGGHVIYTLLGKRARVFVPFILLALLVMGMVWSGWWLWAFIIFLLGRIYAEPLDQITTLNPRRQALAILGLLIFVLVFIPVPLK